MFPGGGGFDMQRKCGGMWRIKETFNMRLFIHAPFHPMPSNVLYVLDVVEEAAEI